MKKVLFTSLLVSAVGLFFASNRHSLSLKSGEAEDFLKVEARNEKILEKKNSKKRKSERDLKEKLRDLPDSSGK